MELTCELRSPQVGEINDERRKRSCRDAEQLSRGERRDVDSESASAAGVSDQRRSRMQPTYEAEEGARRLGGVRHRDHLGRLAQAESEGKST
jgi:hypothetical protein